MHKRGSEDWHFVLHLWSNETETNLIEANKLWENKRNHSLKNKKSENPKIELLHQTQFANNDSKSEIPIVPVSENIISDIVLSVSNDIWKVDRNAKHQTEEQSSNINYGFEVF